MDEIAVRHYLPPILRMILFSRKRKMIIGKRPKAEKERFWTQQLRLPDLSEKHASSGFVDCKRKTPHT
ncbi:MAG: hypothetical protein AAB947_02055, partial [Patescibacteria group bacterium]